MNSLKILIGVTFLCSVIFTVFSENPALLKLGFVSFVSATIMTGLLFLAQFIKWIGRPSHRETSSGSAMLDKIKDDPNFADITNMLKVSKKYGDIDEQKNEDDANLQRLWFTPADLLSDFVLASLVCWLTGWTEWWQIILILIAVLGFVPPKWSFGLTILIFAALFLEFIPLPGA